MRLKFPPFKLRKELADETVLFFPGFVLGRVQVEWAWVSVAPEVSSAKPGDWIGAGHDDVPCSVSHGFEAGAVTLIRHAITALIAQEVAVLGVDHGFVILD